jgi:hypothetical protein
MRLINETRGARWVKCEEVRGSLKNCNSKRIRWNSTLSGVRVKPGPLGARVVRVGTDVLATLG